MRNTCSAREVNIQLGVPAGYQVKSTMSDALSIHLYTKHFLSPSCVQSHTSSPLISQEGVLSSTSQKEKWRLREVRQLVQGHITNQGQEQDLNPRLCDFQVFDFKDGLPEV